MTENEREHALREAAHIAAADAYFAARPASDNPANRTIFGRAFDRGWDAQIKNVGIVCVGVVTGGGGDDGGGSDSLAGTTAPMGQLEAESDGPAIKWVWRDVVMTTPPPWQYLWTPGPDYMSAQHKSGLIAQWRDGEVKLLHLDRVDHRRWDVAVLGAQARELLGDGK